MTVKPIFMLLVAAVLCACRAHRPTMPIEPIPAQYKTESDIEISTAAPRAHFSPVRISSGTLACQPARWRKVVNKTVREQENWVFGVRWGLIKAGEAALSVEGIEPIRGRPAYHLSMDIHATGMTAAMHPYRDRSDAWLDRDSLTTVLVQHSIRESNYQADETIWLDPACQRFKKRTHRLDPNRTEVQQGPLPPHALDVYSALFYLRTLPLASGQSYELVLFAGDKAVPVTAKVGKKDRVKVPAGTFECYQLELATSDPAAAKKVHGIRWWVSVDERHLPVRIRMDVAIGHITADLEKI